MYHFKFVEIFYIKISNTIKNFIYLYLSRFCRKLISRTPELSQDRIRINDDQAHNKYDSFFLRRVFSSK